MDLKELQKEIHAVALEHGWWETPRTFGDVIALCHSELSEAIEEFRGYDEMQQSDEFEDGINIFNFIPVSPKGKPEGIGVELADCIIRILDAAEFYGIDMEKIIKIKHEYNKTRPYRHGGKAL